MNIISAVGSFKGTMDSESINRMVKQAAEEKGHSVCAVPVADGGDGLLTALCSALNAEFVEINTVNALGEPITAKAAKKGKTGIVEMALASGLAILDESRLNPMKASTYGTGVLIKELALSGAETIILGIGGSATNDGGFGCLSALGFDFYGENGEKLFPCGENLERVVKIDDKNVSDEIKRLKIQIACDVTNPLLGENGATYVYAPQKGADEKMLPLLEKGMENYAKAVALACGKDYSALPGTGAAGGLGFGLMAMLGAELEKGAQIVLKCAGFAEMLKTADLVITGEGKIDNQTAFGKLPQIVASMAKASGVNCIALAGSSVAEKEVLDGMGISKVYQLVDFAPLEECMKNPFSVLKLALEDVIKDLS